jgi:hypothetical protein
MTAMVGVFTRLAFGTAVCSALLTEGPLAHAEDTAACTKAYEAAQIQKKKREFLSARRELVTCIRECPAVVQRECGQWLEGLESLVPSIVIHAEAGGEDRTEVKVELDGKVIAERIDGKGIDVDPGQHDLRFSLAGFPPVKKNLVMHEGEQLRVVKVVFEQPDVSTGKGPVIVTRPVPPVVYVFGGIALAGAAGFTTFGLVGTSQRSRLERDCMPNCTDSSVDGVKRNLLFADVSLGIGVVALATGTVLWLTRPSVQMATERTSGGAERPRRASLEVAPSHAGATFLATLPF